MIPNFLKAWHDLKDWLSGNSKTQLYRYVELPQTACANKELKLEGQFFMVDTIPSGVTVSVRFNDINNDLIPFPEGRGVKTPFQSVFLTITSTGATTTKIKIAYGPAVEVVDTGDVQITAMNIAKETGGNLEALAAVDFATETTLALIQADTTTLAAVDFATETTLALIQADTTTLAAVDFATETTLALIQADTTTLAAVDFATQTTLALVAADTATLAAVDFATQTTLSLVAADTATLAAVDFATQTTLALVAADTATLAAVDFATQTTLALVAADTATLAAVDFATQTTLALVAADTATLAAVDFATQTTLALALAGLQGDTIVIGGASRTFTRVAFDVSATTAVVVAGVANQKIYIIGIEFSCDTDGTTFKLVEETTGDMHAAQLFMKGGGKVVGDRKSVCYHTVASDKDVSITTTVGKATGSVWYCQF